MIHSLESAKTAAVILEVLTANSVFLVSTEMAHYLVKCERQYIAQEGLDISSLSIMAAAGCGPCPCPSTDASFASNCTVVGSEVSCTCQEGHVGERCEECAVGHYGDPTAGAASVTAGAHKYTLSPPPPLPPDPPVPCSPCDCSGNEDPSLAQPCDPTPGVCLRCLGNTTGDHCQSCLLTYFGTAVHQNCTSKTFHFISSTHIHTHIVANFPEVHSGTDNMRAQNFDYAPPN